MLIRWRHGADMACSSDTYFSNDYNGRVAGKYPDFNLAQWIFPLNYHMGQPNEPDRVKTSVLLATPGGLDTARLQRSANGG